VVVEQIDRWPVLAACAAASKKATDPVVLAVGDVLAITDHFVITSGSNHRQVRTIAEEVERQITEEGGPKPLRTEGLDDLRWVLLDYGDFVVHVFSPEDRAYYALEDIWGDAPRLDWQEPSEPAAEGRDEPVR
jgi:ribosome-associated protein